MSSMQKYLFSGGTVVVVPTANDDLRNYRVFLCVRLNNYYPSLVALVLLIFYLVISSIYKVF